MEPEDEKEVLISVRLTPCAVRRFAYSTNSTFQ
jgi:hypothetical protein